MGASFQVRGQEEIKKYSCCVIRMEGEIMNKIYILQIFRKIEHVKYMTKEKDSKII
jgi:hypothetical protein